MRLYSFASSSAARLFQFTHPGKGATVGEVSGLNIIAVSIHAPWEGCDRRRSRRSSIDASFNSRTLGRVRQFVSHISISESMFQFTHPGKGATPVDGYEHISAKVSIHAPWEGCDLRLSSVEGSLEVSIHAPWEGCDGVTQRIIIGRY